MVFQSPVGEVFHRIFKSFLWKRNVELVSEKYLNRNICHRIFLLKRKVTTLQLRHIGINNSFSEQKKKAVQLTNKWNDNLSVDKRWPSRTPGGGGVYEKVGNVRPFGLEYNWSRFCSHLKCSWRDAAIFSCQSIFQGALEEIIMNAPYFCF